MRVSDMVIVLWQSNVQNRTKGTKSESIYQLRKADIEFVKVNPNAFDKILSRTAPYNSINSSFPNLIWEESFWQQSGKFQYSSQ